MTHEITIIHNALRKKGSLRWDIAFIGRDHNSPVRCDSSRKFRTAETISVSQSIKTIATFLISSAYIAS